MKSVLYLTAASALLAGSAVAQKATTTGEACAVAASHAASASAASAAASSTSYPRIPADIAYECLKTVPLGKAEAIELVDSIKPYLDWQSDVAYKADPPTTYDWPAYDMFKALDKVRANLVNNVYKSEYDFQSDMYITVFAPGHDGHFMYYSDLLAKVFQFGRPHPLVSISEDGTSLPVIKLYEDVVKSGKTAPTVVKINGEDAVTYLENFIYPASFNQNKDAAWNSLFYSLATAGNFEGSGYFANSGRTRFIYHGANTTLTFANGTDVTFDNYASVLNSMKGITDGASMYQKFCTNGSDDDEDSSSSTSSDVPKLTAVPGFPEHPVDITGEGMVSCYYLEGDLDNTMVLSVMAFEPESGAEFQAVIQNCLAQGKAAGKTKLVVDLSANGGGWILLGYDFMRQLFPNIQEDCFSRWAANDGYLAIAELYSNAVEGFNPYTSNDSNLIYDYESWFNWRFDYDTNGKPFTSFEEKFGPYKFKDTNYTALMKWNFNDNLTTTNKDYGLGLEISGYGSRANLTQPFAAEDMVIIYDGFCGSTCTIAAEFFSLQAGVKSVAMGGRPQEGLIQGVGGIRGSQILTFWSVRDNAQAALVQVPEPTDEQRAILNRYSDLAINRSWSSSVNSRDAIRKAHMKDGTPAQYITEESDCRLYYTAEMLQNVTAVWNAAANAAFNGGKCNAGGITYSGSTSTSRVDVRNRDRRSGALASGVDEASLSMRKAVTDLKVAELASKSTKSAKDKKRLDTMYSQKVVV